MLTQANQIVGLFIETYGQSNGAARTRAHKALSARVTERPPIQLLFK